MFFSTKYYTQLERIQFAWECMCLVFTYILYLSILHISSISSNILGILYPLERTLQLFTFKFKVCLRCSRYIFIFFLFGAFCTNYVRIFVFIKLKLCESIELSIIIKISFKYNSNLLSQNWQKGKKTKNKLGNVWR